MTAPNTRLRIPPASQPAKLAVSYADIVRAAERIDGVAHRTPVLTSRSADALSGATLFFKAENLQRAGAFKFRGACNAIAALDTAQRDRGVLAFSSGNHAQAIALAGRLQGVSATIVMPIDAPAMKIAATRGYGGEVVFYDRWTQDREAVGRSLAQEHGLTVLPPYDHADIIAGQGTAAKELIEEVGPLDVLLACTGGGGLLAGSALAARELSPGCEVVGVEPEAGNDAQQSLRSGVIVTIAPPRTLADGAMTTRVGSLNFPIIQALVADIVTASDAQLVSAMRFFAERMKMIVEPTGCLAAAAALNGAYPLKGKRVGVIISGGNVDLATFARLVGAETENFSMTTIRTGAVLAVILAGTVPSLAQDLTKLPPSLATADATIVASMVGIGAQIYQCSQQQGRNSNAWALVAPTAALLQDGKIVGRHFAGPTWEFTDMSSVRGKVVATAKGGSAADIPWLKLAIAEPVQNGPAAGATAIFRIETRGGAFTAVDCQEAGALHAEPYQATYVFVK